MLPSQSIENDNPTKDEARPSLLSAIAPARPDPFRLEAAKIVATLFSGVDLRHPKVFEESVDMVERVLRRQPLAPTDDPTVSASGSSS